MSLGQQIRRARKQLGMSQQAIASKFGITRAAVAQWELDQTRPDQGRLVVLAELLQTSVGTLLEDGRPLMAKEPTAGAAVDELEFRELKQSWTLLLPSERADILNDIRRRAEHNQAVIDAQTKTHTPVAEYSPQGNDRRRGAVWYGFPDRRQKKEAGNDN